MTTCRPTRPRPQPGAGFLSRLRRAQIHLGNEGAIDLASIMTGVLVIGIIAGVIAATVVAVIPWSQDQAARAGIDSVKTAESAARVKEGKYLDIPALLAAGYLPASAQASAASPADLIRGARGASVAPHAVSFITGDGNPSPPSGSGGGASYVPPAQPSNAEQAISVSPDGQCAVVATHSAAGSVFWATTSSATIHRLPPTGQAPTTDCTSAGAAFPAIASIAQPAAGGNNAPSTCTPTALPHVNEYGPDVATIPAGQAVKLTEPGTQITALDSCNYQPTTDTVTGATIEITVPTSLVGTAIPTVTGRTPGLNTVGTPMQYGDAPGDWALVTQATVGASTTFTFQDGKPIIVDPAQVGGVEALGADIEFNGTSAPAGTYTVGYNVSAGGTSSTYNVTLTVQ